MAQGAATKRLRRCTTTDADASIQPFPVLSKDVEFEILARLPVRSVLMFRSVCKAWLAMLSHPSFVRRHSDRSKENPSTVFVSTQLLAQRRPRRPRRRVMFRRYSPGDEAVEVLLEHPLPGMRGPIYCPAHCDGLLALYDQTTIRGTTYVCNPATRELVALPPCLPFDYAPAYFGHPYVGLCRDYHSGSYKVFHAFYHQSDWSTRAWNVRVEVLTLGAENPQWRVLPSCVHCLDVSAPRCIDSVDGAVYLLFVAKDIATPCSILSLDASTEKFTPVQPPPSDWLVRADKWIMNLREVQGKLCLCCGGSRSNGMMMTDVWFMSGSPASPMWARYCSFSTDLSLSYCVPVLVLNGREILFRLRNSFYSYDPRSGMFNEVTNMSAKALNLEACFEVHTYAESLVAIITTTRSGELQATANYD